MTRDQFISIFFIAVFIFIVVQIFWIFSLFGKAIFWSAILAFAFYPIYWKIRSAFKLHETIAALLSTLLIFLMVIPPLVLLSINMTKQAVEFYQIASDYIRQGQLEKLIEQVRHLSFVQNIESRMLEWEPIKQNLSAWILRTSQGLGDFAADQVAQITKNLLLVILNVCVMTVMIFIFLKDGKIIFDFVYQIAPFEEKNKQYIFRQIDETFSAVIRGQLLTALTQALVAGFAFWALGLPIPIFFASATFITSLIPIVGASTVWLPLVGYLIILHSYTRATILFFFGLLVISLIDNLMKPALIGEKTKLPYFLLFFGILGGIKLYGLMGIFLAPVVLSLFFTLAKIYKEKYC